MILKMIILILSYILGSLSTAIIICKAKYSVDIRTLGSGNAGTTNVLRNFGKKTAALTLLLDAVKGIPGYLAGYYICGSYAFALICGMAAILGHIFPIFYNFKGGKGVATTLGVAVIANPLLALITVIFTFAVMALSRRISLGSLLGILFYTAGAYIMKEDIALVYWGLAATVVIWIKHRENIKRLITGKEPKFSLKK